MKQSRKLEPPVPFPGELVEVEPGHAEPGLPCDPFAELTNHMRSIYLQPEDIAAAKAADSPAGAV